MADVIALGPHTRMTPEEALAFVSREDWEKVMIVGFHKDSNDLVARSSNMTREQALWIIEHAKMHVLGI